MTALQFKSKTINAGMNAKTTKGDGTEYVTAILYLAPHKNSGVTNTCPMAEVAGCTKACLYKAGRGQMTSVESARINKTIWWNRDRDGFLHQLSADIARFSKWCSKKGVKPVVRLNGTSDIQWENFGVFVDGLNIFEIYPEVQFYDYTKIVKRAYKTLPENYTLVLSYSNANVDYAVSVWEAHFATRTNVAVVYRTPEAVQDRMAVCKNMVDGDKDDMRFLDPKGSIVALYAKGPAKHDATGFVIG